MISKRFNFFLMMLPGLTFGASSVVKEHTPPVACEKTIFIQTSPEVVWKRLSDINNWTSTFKSVSTAKLNGPLSPGTTFDWKSGGTSIHSTLSIVTANEQIAWTGRAYTINAIHEWHLKAVNNGTEITVKETMSGFIAWLFKKALNKMIYKDMLESLEQLKAASEG